MKVSIVYFSGTGNTKSVALGYEQALIAAGHNVSLSSIEHTTTIAEHDLLIVGGPIYAGNMPDELINWVRKNVALSKGNQKAMVFSTSAGLLNAHGVKSIGKKLSKKGYTLVDLAAFEMPRNFYIDKYEPTPESAQKVEFETAAQTIIESVNKIQDSEPIVADESVIMIDLLADVFRLMAKSMGKKFTIDDTCIGCGKCERDCPKNNIDYRNKKYSNKCMLCTRCIHGCPVNAIAYKGKKIDQYTVHYEIEL